MGQQSRAIKTEQSRVRIGRTARVREEAGQKSKKEPGNGGGQGEGKIQDKQGKIRQR